jgi:putative ABC transport system permease protein
VLVATLSVVVGIDAMAMRNVRDDRAIVRGAERIGAELSHHAIDTLQSLPGIRRDRDGLPMTSADVIMSVQARKRADGRKANVTVVGVGRSFSSVYPEIHVVAGRVFTPGMNELLVGESARQSYQGLEIGEHLSYQGVRWRIVGMFEASDGLAESWLLADGETLRSAFGRRGYDQMAVLLDSPRSFSALSELIRNIPGERIDITREAEVRREEISSVSNVISFLGQGLGFIMALGATVSCLNTTYAVNSGRRRELATFLAFGFKPGVIALAVFIEALLFSMAGAIAGILLSWLFMSGNRVTFAGLNFALAVNPQLAMLGAAWGALIGAIGGLPPAISAARTSPAFAARAT